jgi:hypothetical protein
MSEHSAPQDTWSPDDTADATDADAILPVPTPPRSPWCDNPFSTISYAYRPPGCTSPFDPPAEPWEHAHYCFRSAYDRVRSVLAPDVTHAASISGGDETAFTQSALFARCCATIAHYFRDTVSAGLVAEIARTVTILAWCDAHGDLATRAPGATPQDEVFPPLRPPADP